MYKGRGGGRFADFIWNNLALTARGLWAIYFDSSQLAYMIWLFLCEDILNKLGSLDES